MELLNAIANSTNEKKILLLPQALNCGELGVDFLIDTLADPCLEIRAKAYQLLQSVKTEKVSQAIASGLLLNPGDRVYSVYQSTMCFTDDGYYLNDSVSYPDSLILLLYEEEFFSVLEEAEQYNSKRLYCYLDREQAEQKAEAIHRELIRDEYIGCLGFVWSRQDSNISIQQWFISTT